MLIKMLIYYSWPHCGMQDLSSPAGSNLCPLALEHRVLTIRLQEVPQILIHMYTRIRLHLHQRICTQADPGDISNLFQTVIKEYDNKVSQASF